MRLIYERKLQRTNDLYNELSACFVQLEEREREIAEREKIIGTSKPYKKAISQLRKQHFDKISRRRLHLAAQLAQSSPCSGNSPSPPSSPQKTSMYVQLDGNQTKSIIQAPTGYSSKKKSRHRRVGSGSSMTVKTSINRDRKHYESSNFVDTHTQTDLKDEFDSRTLKNDSQEPVIAIRTIEVVDSSNESDIDDNVPQDTTSSSQTNNNQAMANSMATSIMTGSNLSYDTEDMSEKHRVTAASDDDTLESLRRKVNELIIETNDSYSTNSSTHTIINKILTKRHSKNCEKSNGTFSCVDLPKDGFVDNNKNIKSIKCSCDEDEIDDEDVRSCSDEEFNNKKFNYSLRMKR